MTEPLVPAEVDCTDLDGFMLNVERLMASELVALSSHEVIGAALLLWCRAWKQRPAASLPNDDKVIAAFARMPLPRFRKLRDEVLRGFVLCSDGRLYHATLAKEACNAYERKVAFQRKREAEAERLRKWRHGTKDETRNETRTRTHDETRFVPEGQGQGQGQGQEKLPTSSGGRGSGSPPDSGRSASPPSPAASPPDPVKAVFDRGVAALGDSTSTRSLIGKARKQFGDLAVIDIIAALEREVPSDPVPWFVAACKARATQAAAAKPAAEPREPRMDEITV